jgi:hypothetical protein
MFLIGELEIEIATGNMIVRLKIAVIGFNWCDVRSLD